MAFFERTRMRTVFVIRPMDFSEEISITTDTKTYWVTDTKTYWVNDTAWQIIVSRWQDREGPGVRVIEVNDNVLIVTMDLKKEKKK